MLFCVFRDLLALASVLVLGLSEMEFRTFHEKGGCFESFVRVLSMTTTGFRAHSPVYVLCFQ